VLRFVFSELFVPPDDFEEVPDELLLPDLLPELLTELPERCEELFETDPLEEEPLLLLPLTEVLLSELLADDSLLPLL